jgi:methyl coenzyme M reductase alpha subunit
MASQHAKETGKARDHASAADAHQRQAHRAEDEGDTEAAKYHKREMERHDKEAKAQYDKMDQNHPDRAGLSAYEDDLETRLSKVPDLRHKISKSDLEAYQQDLQYMGSRADRESKWADDLPQSKSAGMSHATAAHDHTGAAVLAFQIGDRKKGEYHKNKALYHDKAATKLGY